MVSKIGGSAVLFVVFILMIGLAQVWAQDELASSPAVLAEQVVEASGAELRDVQYRWSGDAGESVERADFERLAAKWAEALAMPEGSVSVSDEGLLSYATIKRQGPVEAAMTMHGLGQGGSVHVSVKVSSAAVRAAELVKRDIATVIRQLQEDHRESPDWTWMVKGTVKQAARGTMGGAAGLSGEYHDRNTDSYTYETKKGNLQVMVHRNTENHAEEIILGYPAIGSLN